MKKDNLRSFGIFFLFIVATSFVASCSDDEEPPAVVSMNPNTGYPGSLITFTGSNFFPEKTTVSFNGVAADIKSITSSEIIAKVPAEAQSGQVTIQTSGGTVDAGLFTIRAYPQPAIDPVTFVGAYEAHLNGALTLGTDPIDDHGFIYAQSEITSEASGIKISLGSAGASGPVSVMLEDLAKNTSYFARAYVHLGDTTLLSDQISFTTANTNEWIKVSSGFPAPEYDAFSLNFRSISNQIELDGKAYLIGDDASAGVLPVYEYDPKTNQLTRMPDLPGTARSFPARFVAGGQVFVGMGATKTDPPEYLADFYSFTPGTKTWTRVKDFGGTAMGIGVTVSFGDIAYVGFGAADVGMEKGFWQYNATTDTWTEKTSPLNEGWLLRQVLMSVSIGDKGYFVFHRGGILEVWEYNPLADEWVRKNDYAGTVEGIDEGNIHPFMSTTVKGKGYFVDRAGNVIVYDPAGDAWASIPAPPEKGMHKFTVSIDDKLYTGSRSSVYMYIPE